MSPEKPRARSRRGPRRQFLNREMSWVAFDERVLEEALDPANPLLERLRFLAIFYTNLDEFFMIRISGLKEQAEVGVGVRSFDGLSPKSQLARVSARLRPLLETAERALMHDLLPQLAEHGVEVVRYAERERRDRKAWDRWFVERVAPVLTPLAVGPAQPFPWISNLSLNLAVMVRSPDGEQRMARVKIPPNLPRLVRVDDDRDEDEGHVRLLPLEELVAANLHHLFPGMDVGEPWFFRVTRDTDVEILDDEADDLLAAVEREVRKRRFGEAVRLEVQAGMPATLRETLRRALSLDAADVYEVTGLLAVPALSQLWQLDLPELKYPPFVPRRPPRAEGDLFKAIRAGDLLLHHPFDSFETVEDFLFQAARDAHVQAIKVTLYRTSGDSSIIRALEDAVERGKQVAAVVELKARFDEENNVAWARRLEEAGVHVVYGMPGLKVHCKLMLVVRSEGEGVRRYAHIGTGNYNPSTARVYTDFGLLTTNAEICADVSDVFNQLTGFALPPAHDRLLVAPRFMQDGLIHRIRREAAHARKGKPGRIVAKCNAISEPDVIRELYAASREGVQIDLIARGICCLMPGLKDLSENIRVRSVVGRFLEHSRLYWFDNDGDPEVFIGSADLMNRNLARRIEVLVPVEDPDLKAWLRDVLIASYLQDTARVRLMQPDGSYVRGFEPGTEVRDRGFDVQAAFVARQG